MTPQQITRRIAELNALRARFGAPPLGRNSLKALGLNK